MSARNAASLGSSSAWVRFRLRFRSRSRFRVRVKVRRHERQERRQLEVFLRVFMPYVKGHTYKRKHTNSSKGWFSTRNSLSLGSFPVWGQGGGGAGVCGPAKVPTRTPPPHGPVAQRHTH